MVHSRFSTNTFPSWDRAQPNRFMSHNGEINTVRGNMNWMNAREGVAKTELFGDDLKKLFPIVEPDCSDSGKFDNVLEFLLMSGRTLQEAVHDDDSRGVAEPPNDVGREARVLRIPLLHDGTVGRPGVDRVHRRPLHRRGARPQRPAPEPLLHHARRQRCIMASEVGVLPIDPENVKVKGRLQPGKMFLIDFEQGRMIPDEELKGDFAQPPSVSANGSTKQRVELSDLRPTSESHGFDPENAARSACRRSATRTETMQFMLLPMIREGRDPIGSMGNDAALACCPNSRACCTTTSSNCSRRSRIRRSIRSAKK